MSPQKGAGSLLSGDIVQSSKYYVKFISITCMKIINGHMVMQKLIIILDRSFIKYQINVIIVSRFLFK
jgi:hypothetical protein